MLISQDDFDDEDVVENCLIAQSSLDSDAEHWKVLAQAGSIRYLNCGREYVAVMLDDGFANGKVVCSMTCDDAESTPFGDGLKVDTVAVLPDYRGRSLARSLYEAILAEGRTLYAGDQTPSGMSIWLNIIENSARPVFAITDDETDEVEQVLTKAQYIRMSRIWPNPIQFVLPHDGPALDAVLDLLRNRCRIQPSSTTPALPAILKTPAKNI